MSVLMEDSAVMDIIAVLGQSGVTRMDMFVQVVVPVLAAGLFVYCLL